MKKIAIRFGDNDFGNTFMAVLRHLKDAHDFHKEVTTDKVRLAEMISKLAIICYVTHQNHFDYNGFENVEAPFADSEYYKSTERYLTVTPDQILINEEVDAYVAATPDDNSETFVLDTTLYNNQIYFL